MVNSEGGRDPRSKLGPGRREFTGHLISNEGGRGQSMVSLWPVQREVLGDVPGEQQKRGTLWMWAWQVASGVEERPPMENRNHEAESGAWGRAKIKTKEWKPASVRDCLAKSRRGWSHDGPGRSSGRKEMVNTTGKSNTAGETNKTGTEKASIGESLVSLVKIIPGINGERKECRAGSPAPVG